MKRVERWEEKRYVGNLKGTRVLGDQNFFVIYATSKDNRMKLLLIASGREQG